MKINLLSSLALLLVISFSQAQKVKTIKYPMGWTYEISPTNPLDSTLRKYETILDTEMDPLTYRDEVELGMQVLGKSDEAQEEFMDQARIDTLNMLRSDYLGIHEYPFIETTANPDFTISFKTDRVEVENIQMNIDYEDPESILGKINISGRLTVKSRDGEVFLDQKIPLQLEGEPENYVRLKHFNMDLTFKTKMKMAKKPEKKEKLLKRKFNRYQADLIRVLLKDAQEVIADNFEQQKQKSYAAFYGIKDKKFTALNEQSQLSSKAVNSLQALSKKNRRTTEEVSEILKTSIPVWENSLNETSNEEIKKLLRANLALAAFLLEDKSRAEEYIGQIPEFQNLGKTVVIKGSFRYYAEGLTQAMSIKKKYEDRAAIYQL